MSKKDNGSQCVLRKTSVGGQALLEGIMMQGPRGAAMSVRLPDGTVETEPLEFKRLKDRFKPAGFPLIRGVVNFIETLLFGYKCMNKSAEKAGIDDSVPKEDMSKLDRWLSDHFGPKMMAVITGIAGVLGILLAFFLFFYLPTISIDLLDKHLFASRLADFHAPLEGVIRICIFVLYLFLVSRIPDIKRVFMYHGAEHKSIFCYEKGLELTVENVRMQKRFHPRCGTSFIFVMLLLGILISSAITLIFDGIDENRILWMAIKLLIMPFVISLGYEFIKYAGRHDNFLIKALSAPGLLMQRLTTAEPTDDIIEVGIDALKAVITDNPEDDTI